MKQKNQLPVKWMIGTLIFVTVLVYGTGQISKNLAIHEGINIPSHNIFIQFLENIFGAQFKSILSNETSQESNTLNQNNPNSRQAGALNSANPQNPNSMTSGNLLESQGGNGTQKSGSASAAGGMNADNILKNSAQNNAEYNSEISPENNAEYNADNNPTYTSDNNTGGNAENNSAFNAATNADQGTGNLTGTGSGDNSGGSSGSSSVDNSGGNTGGNSSGSGNQNNLPTINPIPSDSEVSQSVSQQNQQNDALTKELASRQALVVPVQQQAQASKYQSVTYQNIPTPSANPAPGDIQAKVQSKQYSFH